MISYAPLWRTMALRGATTYTLRTKGKHYSLGGDTVKRLKAGQSVSTNTLDALCQILNCRLDEVAEYIPDEKQS